MISLMLDGAFERFPSLNIYFAETMAAWLPSWNEQLDDTYRRNKHWMERDFGLDPLSRQPSEYMLNNASWGIIHDPMSIKLRDDMNINNIMWGSDFPHSASDWPNSMAVLDSMFEGVPDDERTKITCANAVRFFHLDNGN